MIEINSKGIFTLVESFGNLVLDGVEYGPEVVWWLNLFGVLSEALSVVVMIKCMDEKRTCSGGSLRKEMVVCHSRYGFIESIKSEAAV
jgi:hypothetical protein